MESSFPLLSLDKYMLTEVFNKMDARSFCRLQRTCKTVSDIVEANKKAIGVRIPKLLVSKKNVFYDSYNNYEAFQKLCRKDGWTMAEKMRGLSIEVLKVNDVPGDSVIEAELAEALASQKGPLTTEWEASHQGDLAYTKPHILLSNSKPQLVIGHFMYHNAVAKLGSFQKMTKNLTKKRFDFWHLFAAFPRVELLWENAGFGSQAAFNGIPKEWAQGVEIGVCRFLSVFMERNCNVEGMNILQNLCHTLECEKSIVIKEQTIEVSIYKVCAEDGREAALILSQRLMESRDFIKTNYNHFFAFVPNFNDYLHFLEIYLH